MNHSPDEIGAKMNALGLWETISQFNWAVRPRGTVFPYFCTALKGEQPAIKARFLMLEGWQTLHEYVITRADRNFGYVSAPIELPHFEMVVLSDDHVHLFRHDAGFMPRPLVEREQSLVERLLWESYGIMLRIEADNSLMYRYVEERSMFSRVEGADGTWSDEPLSIPQPVFPKENVSVGKLDLDKAHELPLAADWKLDVDFRLLPHLATREKRPRTVYALIGIDPSTRERVIDSRVSIGPDGSLKQLWEEMPHQFVLELIRLGRIPGEVRMVSGRTFRLMRALCLELPFKLSLHDHLDTFNNIVS